MMVALKYKTKWKYNVCVCARATWTDVILWTGTLHRIAKLTVNWVSSVLSPVFKYINNNVVTVRFIIMSLYAYAAECVVYWWCVVMFFINILDPFETFSFRWCKLWIYVHIPYTVLFNKDYTVIKRTSRV